MNIYLLTNRDFKSVLMTTINLKSRLYTEILVRSKTIKNLIGDFENLDELKHNIPMCKNFDKELMYLQMEKIDNIDISNSNDYIKILIERLEFYVYLDMDEEIDIKPLAKYIGEAIEPRLIYYLGTLIDVATNEYIGLIKYDTLYLIIENHPILHVYKELEKFDISNNFYQEILNNIPKYVSPWFHNHQEYLLNYYEDRISNKYYEKIHIYIVLFTIFNIVILI